MIFSLAFVPKQRGASAALMLRTVQLGKGPSAMKVAIVIASVGRPTELARWTDHCARQTQQPTELIYSISAMTDLPANFDATPARVVVGPKGSAHQRNTGLQALETDADIAAFFGDDYVPSRRCIEGIACAFAADPNLAGTSGHLLADGINSAGIDYDQARQMVEAFDADDNEIDLFFERAMGTYGCNMAFRRSKIEDDRFDERLPLYAWQEDVDFSNRLRKRGGIGRSNAFVGVHQGIKGGRSSGYRLGYSQVANPLYLIRKGTMPTTAALWLIARNVMSNHAKALRPEPWVDRAGRLAGNWRAFADLATGRMKPERVLAL